MQAMPIECKLVKKHPLPTKKPVTWLRATGTASRKLLALSDGTLFILQQHSLAPATNMSPQKGVTCVSIDEKDPTLGIVAVGRKRSIQVYEVVDRMTLEKVMRARARTSRPAWELNASRCPPQEIAVASTPLAVFIHGTTVCYCDERDYHIIDLVSSEMAQLAPFNSDPTADAATPSATPLTPHIKLARESELLISSVANGAHRYTHWAPPLLLKRLHKC